MRTITLIVASAVFLFGSVNGQPNEDPTEMWMTGFLQIQDGVKAGEVRNNSLAIGKFQEALLTYHDIARRYPAFESARRTERIHLLSAKIKFLGGIPIAFEPLARNGTVFTKNLQSVPAELPAMPSTWVAKKEIGVVLPAVITPETRSYRAEFEKWWALNGRIQTEFALLE
jgi:hypothetical protein